MKKRKLKNYRNRKDEVWEKGKPIPSKDPKKYRKDKYDNEMYYNSYGKNTPKGWVIDHSKPTSKGGTNHLNNLQPLNTTTNREKSNKYPYTCNNK